MGRISLTVLAVLFLIAGVVAWYVEPTRKVDWVPLVALAVAVGAVDLRLREIQKRLNALDRS